MHIDSLLSMRSAWVSAYQLNVTLYGEDDTRTRYCRGRSEAFGAIERAGFVY